MDQKTRLNYTWCIFFYIKNTDNISYQGIKVFDTVPNTHSMTILSKIMPKLPDRTVIFLSALYFWAYAMFYFTKIISVSLGFVLRNTPDAFIIHGGAKITNDKDKTKPNPDTPKINIIQAFADNIPITNKLKNLIHRKWDKEVGEDANGNNIGGLNVRDILTFVKSPMIWVSYLFEFDKKLSDMSDDEIGKAIKTMLIDFGDKALYRESNLAQKEPILFGEIPF